MERKLLFGFIFLILSVSLPANTVRLNKFGHIDFEQSPRDAEYFIENDIYKINYENHDFKGNSIYKLKNGYLTLTAIHENVPSQLRIYNNSGTEEYSQQFPKIINLNISQNNRYIAFFDGDHLIVLDSKNFEIEKFPESVKFVVDNAGNPICYRTNDASINYKNKSVELKVVPSSLILFEQKSLIFAGQNIYTFGNRNLKIVHTFQNKIFEAKTINGSLYCVVREKTEQAYLFKLFRSEKLRDFAKIDEKSFSLIENRTPEPIQAPLDYSLPNNNFPIGNSYGEIQQYGSSPYLHPGVDFLGDDFQPVYAVHDGYVKAVLTTGGAAYWRVAIGNEDLSTEIEGYLYAHLNQSSISVTEGDFVEAGQQIGTLYPWGYYDFTHIHFARVECSGATWNGNWWTIDDVLCDVTNMIDFTGPVFENAVGNDLFAFRDTYGNYLDANNLNGELDIIAKCHDYANSTWRVDVHDLKFKLHPANDPGSTVYELFSYNYNFPLDTYISGAWDSMILNTIYSRDATCYSVGDYENREYYHIITNSNGDSTITDDDQYENFDTEGFPDGEYLLEVIAHDASGNESSASMNISFNNFDVDEQPDNGGKMVLSNFPNPFTESTTISFNLNKNNTENLKISIYNIIGEKIKTLPISPSQSRTVSVVWDGKNSRNKHVGSGIYLIKLRTEKEVNVKKIIKLER